MEIVLPIIAIGLILLVISFMNSSSFRDPIKLDVIDISAIDEEKLAKYPNVCLLINNYSRSTFSRSNRESIDKVKVYSIFLLTSNHRGKIKIAGFKNKEEAKKNIISISEKYSKNIVKYNPQISSRRR